MTTNDDDTEDKGLDQNGGAEVPDAYVIPRGLAQATLDYLASQPYRQVFALVQAFEALEPLTPERSRPSTSS
jgi:hypothetical protein